MRPGEPASSVDALDTSPPPAPFEYDLVNARHIRPIPVTHVESWPVDAWASRFPDAQRELRAWVKSYPETAERIFEWDDTETAQVKVLVEWAITHPYESIYAFLLNKHEWGQLHTILEAQQREGLDAFLGWCRRAPQAADELVAHPRGLAWSGEHLFSESRGARR
jgi:hypothetical protein